MKCPIFVLFLTAIFHIGFHSPIQIWSCSFLTASTTSFTLPCISSGFSSSFSMPKSLTTKKAAGRTKALCRRAAVIKIFESIVAPLSTAIKHGRIIALERSFKSRIYVQQHTPQKGMSLILDTVSQLRGCATQFGHIPIGWGDERDVTHHYHSLLTTPTINDSPACPHPPPPLSFLQALPCIPHICRNTSQHRPNTTQHQCLWTDTDVLSLTPACTTSHDVSNPAPVFVTQCRHLQPNTYILSPMPASMTSTDLYNPTLACTTPTPMCKALFQAKHQHVQPNASKQQMARIWWEPA